MPFPRGPKGNLSVTNTEYNTGVRKYGLFTKEKRTYETDTYKKKSSHVYVKAHGSNKNTTKKNKNETIIYSTATTEKESDKYASYTERTYPMEPYAKKGPTNFSHR